MLEVKQYEKVTQYRLGTEHDGTVLYWCACYQIDDLLIDTGHPHGAAELLMAVKGKGIKRAVNTHHHEDHIGANVLLRDELGVVLFAPQKSLELIENGFPLKFYQEVAWGHPLPSRPNPLGSEIATDNFSFQVIETPGHSQDHVVLFEPSQGWAFTGDVYFGAKPKTARADEDFAQCLESLKKLRALEPKVLFSGLGDVIPDACAALDVCIDHLEQTAARIRALAARGLDPAAIVAEMFGRESSLSQLTEGHMSYENFVRAFAAD